MDETVPPQSRGHGTPLTRVIAGVTGALGSFSAILASIAIVTSWLLGGLFVPHHYANSTYQQLLISTVSIITFLMVFIIQHGQNRDSRALQAKLDAQSGVLVAIAEQLGLSDERTRLLCHLVGIEEAPEKVIKDKQDVVRSGGGLN